MTGVDGAASAPTSGAHAQDSPSPDGARDALLVVHTGREATRKVAIQAARRLAEAGFALRVLPDEYSTDEGLFDELPESQRPRKVEADSDAAFGMEIVLVLGGDGTLLRAAELARHARVPMLGVNLGRVGFLAEADIDDLDEVLDAVVGRTYRVEERMTVDVVAHQNGTELGRTWALNEAIVEKMNWARLLDIVLEVDGRPVSEFACDGVLCATPTGSTAYAFSAGGPVVWPEVQAMLLVPEQRARAVRPAAGDLAGLAGGAGGVGPRGRGRARVRRAPDHRAAAGLAGRGRARTQPRPARPAARPAVHRPAGPQVRAPGAGLARPDPLSGAR